MIGTGSYVLMLVYVDDNGMDIGGNEYPSEGYVEAENFTHDIDIEFGLYGIMWGKTSHFSYEKLKSGKWIVVKTEINEDLIQVNWFYNRYKFKCGIVVHVGDIKSASQHIIDNKSNRKDGMIEEGDDVRSFEIAGSKEWMENMYSNGHEMGMKNGR